MNQKLLLPIFAFLLATSIQKILVSRIKQINTANHNKLLTLEHTIITPYNTPNHFSSSSTVRIYPPFGYDYNTGPTWNIICLAGQRGRIPGRLDKNGIAYYSFGNKVYHCQKYYKISGTLVYNSGMPPQNCMPTGQQSDNEKELYSTIVETLWGNVPGKAFALSDSNYIHEGMSFYGKSFYWVC